MIQTMVPLDSANPSVMRGVVAGKTGPIADDGMAASVQNLLVTAIEYSGLLVMIPTYAAETCNPSFSLHPRARVAKSA